MHSPRQKCLAKSIAIIGAGPSGLATARYLSAEKYFANIEVFEQRSHVGGLWKYTPESTGDGLFKVPQTNAHAGLELPVQRKEKSVFLSPIYERLETNIPKTLMGFSDTPFDPNMQLFPKHGDVQRYLEQYSSGIPAKLRFDTQVLDIRLKGPSSSDQDEWLVEYKGLSTGSIESQIFNAVVIATGHYSTPYVPDIDGLKHWDQKYPGSISHSKNYRRPEEYIDKKVVVVGGSASGLDIASQIATDSKAPLLLSQKSVSYLAAGFADNPNIKSVAQIIRVDATSKKLIFADGSEEADVDALLFCTGYLYTLPMLKSLQPQPVGDGTRLQHTYQHLLYAPRPSIAFMALPQKIIPFPLAEAQAAVLARIWSGRLTLPSQKDMEEWEHDVIAERGDGGDFHTLKFPKDAQYINMLYDWAANAGRREGLENDGVGKLPRRWGAWEYWARENFPAMRKAFVSRGDDRHDVKTLEDVGFQFCGITDEGKVQDTNAAL